jgi:hypothetical protein
VATRIATGILQDHNGNFVLDLDNGTLTIGGGASLGSGSDTVSSMLTTLSATASGLSSEITRAETAEGALSAVYSGSYVPTASNSPASAWNTTALKQQHINDLFYNTTTGDSYMWKEAKGGVIITFDAQSATESISYDYVVVYYYDSSTGNYKYTTKYGGKGNSNTISGLRLFVPSNSFYVYWKTDSSVVDWGFKVIKCEAGAYATGDISTLYPNSTSSLPRSVTSTISGTSTMPETDHEYTSSDEKLWQWNTQVTIPTGDYNWAIQASVSTAYSQIKQTADQISLKVSKGNISSELSLETGAITLSTTGRLIITSGNFKLDSSGTMTCVNANISGTITLGKANNSSGRLYLYESDGSTVRLQLDNTGLITFGRSNSNPNISFKAIYGFKGSFNVGSYYQWYSNGIAYYKNSESEPFAAMGVQEFSSSDTSYYPQLSLFDKGAVTIESRDAVSIIAGSSSYRAWLWLAASNSSLMGNNLAIESFNGTSYSQLTLHGSALYIYSDFLYANGSYAYSGSSDGSYRFVNGIAVLA